MVMCTVGRGKFGRVFVVFMRSRCLRELYVNEQAGCTLLSRVSECVCCSAASSSNELVYINYFYSHFSYDNNNNNKNLLCSDFVS